jgi:hypothetical protein
MTNQRTNLRVDPYFDSSRNQRGDDTVYQSYQSPDNIVLQSGGTMGSAIGTGANGLRGTIIPQATRGGIPMGTRPHDTANMEVNIDPHIPGQSVTVRLGDLTNASVWAASQEAQANTPEPTDLASMRLRGAAIMHNIAAGRQKAASAPAPNFQYNPAELEPDAPFLEQFPSSPRRVVPVQQSQPMVPPRTRRVSPLSAFNQAPQAAPMPGAAIQPEPMYVAQQRAVQPVAPMLTVVFELEHFGSLEANYHDVIVENGFVVLVYDTRHTGATKYFPNSAQSDEAPPMAINIVGSQEVYLVHTTGLQFSHNHNEYCILMIDQIGALPGG